MVQDVFGRTDTLGVGGIERLDPVRVLQCQPIGSSRENRCTYVSNADFGAVLALELLAVQGDGTGMAEKQNTR